MLLRVKGFRGFPVLRPFRNRKVIVLPVGEVRMHAGVEFDPKDNSRRLVVFTESGDRFIVFDDVRLNVFSKQHSTEVQQAPNQVIHDDMRGNAVRLMFDADETRYWANAMIKERLGGFGFSAAVVNQCIRLMRGPEK